MLFLLLGSFDFDDLAAIIGATGRTDAMRQFGSVTLGAFHQGWRFHSEVTAAFALARLGILSLW